MRKIEINGGRHCYLCDYNVVVNSSFVDTYAKHAGSRKVTVIDPDISVERLRHRATRLSQVIFQVTQDCNLRCKYCAFGGTYAYERQRTGKRLSREAARAGIDYLADLLAMRTDLPFAVSFFGGEPTLELELIRDVVSYARSRLSALPLSFNITTNLASVTSTDIDYFAEQDFLMAVSLDGPRENHDEKRIFASGRGSFDSIYRTLQRARDKHPEWYRDRVTFDIVFSQDLPFGKLYRFFQDDELVNQSSLRLSAVNRYNTSYFDQYPIDHSSLRVQMREIIAEIAEKLLREETLLPIERALLVGVSKARLALSYTVVSTLANTCTLDDRLFVDVDGRFHVCEKMNESFPIGDVWSGIDFERFQEVLQSFKKLLARECMDCDIRSLCNRCLVAFPGDGELKIPEHFCRDKRNEVVMNLETYARLTATGMRDYE